MRVLSGILTAFLLHSAAPYAQPTNTADPLSRRAELGAVIRPPASTSAARVIRIDEASALARAGLRAGDEVLGLDGRPFADAIDFDRRIAALRAGQQVTLDVSRGGQGSRAIAAAGAAARDAGGRAPPRPRVRAR
jgi:S1-C subfamily serine protease